jgi:hypothetical protein
MGFYPGLGPEFYVDDGGRDIKSRMEAFYADAITNNLAYWTQGDFDTRFYCNDQDVYNDCGIYGNVPILRRKTFAFNRIMRVVNLIGGYQRRNRKSTTVTPVENGDQETADQFTKILLWVHNQESVLETISEAFHGALVTGMNLLEVWVDWREDPISGNIKVDNNAYNQFLIDPFFRKKDLSDCNGIWKRTWMTKQELVTMLPGHEDQLISMSPTQTQRDAKFQFMPEAYQANMRNLLPVDQFHYRDFRSQKLLIDTQTGETMEWRSENKERLKLYLHTFPTVSLSECTIPTTRLAIVVQNIVMYDGPNVAGVDTYPMVGVYAYYNPQINYYWNRIQGVVRGLRDAQFLYNRRKAIELDILESQLNSGWIVTEDSTINPDDLYQQTNQGRVVFRKAGSKPEDLQRIESPAIPPTTLQLSEILAREINEISGVNEEMLGSAQDDKAGILSMLRQGAGLTTLNQLYDQLDFSQKQLGKIMMDIIQTNFTPGKIKKILEGQEPAPQFYNKAFGKYHCVIEEGLNTSTQRQMQFAQMVYLKNEAGVPITNEDLLEASTIQNKKKIIENATKNAEQQQQLAMQQAQAQVQELQARVRLSDATAESQLGSARERNSRTEENRALAVEKMHEANRADSAATLDMIRAIKELQTIDMTHLKELVSMASALKKMEQNQSSQEANGSPEVRGLEPLRQLNPAQQ